MTALVICSLLILIFVWGFFRTGRTVPVIRKDRPKGAALLAELQKQMDEFLPGPGDIIQPRPVFRLRLLRHPCRVSGLGLALRMIAYPQQIRSLPIFAT